MGKKSKKEEKPSKDLLPVTSDKKHKAKKSKLPAAVGNAVADQLQGTTASDAIAAAAAAKAAKKLRKEQKKEAKLPKATPASPENGTSAGPSQATQNGAQPSNKAKKRKTEAPDASEPAAEPASKQKAKKAKSKPALDGAGQGGSLLAAVGDVALARSSRKLVKDLYNEHAAVSQMTKAEVEKWQQERSIAVVGDVMKPVLAFQQSGLSQELLHATKDFQQPSPIQAISWPYALSGKDVIGIAATGSGKTLAFGLPGLNHVRAQQQKGIYQGKGPGALVLAPTRELAQQISAVLEDAGSKCGLSCLCAYGGVPKGPQAKLLRQGIDVVVATPGRLEDLINDGSCGLTNVSYLVLDEADRMLDLGFEPHIRAIAQATRADRQTLMFSATWPSAIQRLASEFLCNPVRLTIGSEELSAAHSVHQIVEVIDPMARQDRLDALLKKYHGSRKNRVLVFVLYKKEASRIETFLQRRGWKAAAIHGDVSQSLRTQAMEDFKAGTQPLLIATDVAARGLDVPDVSVVINFSFPLTTEDYVHRIGRTGRAGKSGVAHTFFSGATDKPRAGELINVLREAGQVVPPELAKFGTTVKKKESKLYGAHFKEVDFTAKASKTTFDSDEE
ncbi:hypothetical protein WJX74_008611 [Apatococcus lobatus]|uniref:RNA helicase n=1 Tax=Apatococcus lobatus TaxID=904363 RepID=A0AAW1SAC9_9CHLO